MLQLWPCSALRLLSTFETDVLDSCGHFLGGHGLHRLILKTLHTGSSWKLEDLCARLGAMGETATGHLVCEDESEAGVVSLRTVALDFARAVDEVAVLVEEEHKLDHAVEIAVWMGAPQKGNLWRGEPNFSDAHYGMFFGHVRSTPFICVPALWSLRLSWRTCYFSPNICLSLPITR